MTIWEVWDRLEEIHEAIFSTDDDAVTRHWLSVCKLPGKRDLENQLSKEYEVAYLQKAWVKAFGGWELPRARTFLKRMMLFMIFGSDMAYADRIFDNGNLAEFFEKFPLDNERQWAFGVCFGRNADWQTIKSKTSKILRRSP